MVQGSNSIKTVCSAWSPDPYSHVNPVAMDCQCTLSALNNLVISFSCILPIYFLYIQIHT